MERCERIGANPLLRRRASPMPRTRGASPVKRATRWPGDMTPDIVLSMFSGPPKAEN